MHVENHLSETQSPPPDLSRLRCLTGAQKPEAPTIYPLATKISNREPEWVNKTYDSQAKFRWTNNKIPCSFCTFETKTENVWSSDIAKKIFPPIKGKQTSTCLEIRFCDFPCSEVPIWKWRWMNLKVFEKPDKKLQYVENQEVSNYMWHTLLLQVCSVFYLVMNTNSTLGGFFYHLFSVVYSSLFLLYVLW